MERSHLEFALRNCSLPWRLPGEESASTTPEKRLLNTFSWREKSVISLPRFTAIQRYPSNLISKLHFFGRRQRRDRLAPHRLNGLVQFVSESSENADPGSSLASPR